MWASMQENLLLLHANNQSNLHVVINICLGFIIVCSHTGFHSYNIHVPGRVAQSVTCLATDTSLTADPGVASSIPARSHTFVEIDHEIISTIILLPSAVSFKKGCCSYKRKYVHEVLVNCLFKLAQEKVWLGELTVPQ